MVLESSKYVFNPFWQIMENSSRILSEIFIFQVVTQASLLENSSKRKHFVENNISRILGCHPDRFSGKLIQTKCYISYMVSVKKIEWMSFPVKRPGWHPENENFRQISGWVFHDLPIRVKDYLIKWEFSENRLIFWILIFDFSVL